MVALSRESSGSARRETASLIVQALVTRIAGVMGRPDGTHPLLRPTIFVPVRRGEILTWQDVVARRV